MGRRKVIIKQIAADNIAAIAWFIESQGLIATANKFTEDVLIISTGLLRNRYRIPFAGNLTGQL